MTDHALEPAAHQLADATSRPPFLYELGVDGARRGGVRRVRPVAGGALPGGDRAGLRDRAEPTRAGVRTTAVRYNGTLHDFMTLNPVRGTAAATAAVDQAVSVLRTALESKS